MINSPWDVICTLVMWYLNCLATGLESLETAMIALKLPGSRPRTNSSTTTWLHPPTTTIWAMFQLHIASVSFSGFCGKLILPTQVIQIVKIFALKNGICNECNKKVSDLSDFRMFQCHIYSTWSNLSDFRIFQCHIFSTLSNCDKLIPVLDCLIIIHRLKSLPSGILK